MRIRGLFRPTGQHRGGATAQLPTDHLDEIPRDGLLDDGLVEQLLADGDIEANDLAYCPAEQRSTYHAIHTDGSRTCWTCHTTTGGDL